MPCNKRRGLHFKKWGWQRADVLQHRNRCTGQGERLAEWNFLFLDYKSKSAEQSKTLYLRLLVFHMQFLGYFAQGHNKFWVSVIQTEQNKETKKREKTIKTPHLQTMWEEHKHSRVSPLERLLKDCVATPTFHWPFIFTFITQKIDISIQCTCKYVRVSTCLYSITDHHCCHINTAQTPLLFTRVWGFFFFLMVRHCHYFFILKKVFRAIIGIKHKMQHNYDVSQRLCAKYASWDE